MAIENSASSVHFLFFPQAGKGINTVLYYYVIICIIM